MLDVLYVDNHLLVLNKPAGLLCQPNETQDPSLEGMGKAWVKEKFHKPGNVFLAAAHRIDRPVSGVVLFARTSKALSRLNAFMREGRFHKIYLALVEGTFFAEEGVLEHLLVKEEFCTRIASGDEPNAKKCLLKYRVLQKGRNTSLLEITLLTGRYHQIRAQLAAEGHPIVGDRKYGSQGHSPTLFLHHASLTFPHPVSQEMIHIEAPLPAAWEHFYP